MMKPDFSFCHTVTLQRWLGRGVTGEEYGEAVESKARVNLTQGTEWRKGAQVAAGGAADGVAYLPAGAAVRMGDRLNFDGATYCVCSVKKRYDLRGNVNHLEVGFR